MKVVASCSPSERLQTVQDYTEVMTPVVYCIYMIVVSHLPNRAFYANLKEADDDSIVHNIDNIMLYGSLELLSYVLGWKLRVSSTHQFAFVLETQWDLTSLEHYGSD
uniref:Uncharacterized protein n=1 Tax=Globisporangium ultimum (strain ATCC 200006 / CBS 805.95 / DAOM BR144) TaxID=431595 RepID=K3X5K2_GLOUD